jgi:hypothetical protein
MATFAAIFLASLGVSVLSLQYKSPPATFDAGSYTSWAKERVVDKSSGAVSRKATVHVSLDEDSADYV